MYVSSFRIYLEELSALPRANIAWFDIFYQLISVNIKENFLIVLRSRRGKVRVAIDVRRCGALVYQLLRLSVRLHSQDSAQNASWPRSGRGAWRRLV